MTPDRLSDHMVICAYGRVGRTVARALEAEGHTFIVVERRAELEDRMASDGVQHVIGDPTSEIALRRASVEHARALISAVDSDADNVFITLTARALNRDLFIVARASDPATRDRLERAGADRVISPYVSSGRHMARLALRPRVVDYLEFHGADGRSVLLEELAIEEGSPLIGTSLAELSTGGRPLVLRRQEGDVITRPDPEEALRSGDLVVWLDTSAGERRS